MTNSFKNSKLLFVISIILFFACKKNNIDSTTPAPQPPEIENTVFAVSKVNTEIRTIYPVANTSSYLLGYGYDINGRYADSNSARNQVIDVQHYGAKYPGRLVLERVNQTGSPYIITASNAEVFSELLSKRIDETKTLHSFKNSLTSLTDLSSLSKKYSYAWAMYYIWWRRVRLTMGPVDSVKSSLSAAFTTDVANLEPAALVQKYGTHVLVSINMGSKLELTYQAESKSIDKESKALIGISRGSSAIFGLSTGYHSSGPAYINSNINQKIYYKTAGGDPATLPQFPADNTINPRLSFTNWFASSTLENSSLIDINQDGLMPLSDFVFNPAKKAALKAYTDSYIANNTVRVTE